MRSSLLIAVVAFGGAGCSVSQVYHVPPPADGPVGEAFYRVGCGDVLEITNADHPAWDSLVSVDVDGRLPLPEAGRPTVQGLTVDEVRDKLARSLESEPRTVGVRLVDARSGRLYIIGPEAHRQRSVAYRGPERVVEFLYRAGALKPGCSDLNDVHVLRPNVAAGGEPELYRVDVEAIVLDGDPATNVILRPSDQVTVGETTRSRFSRRLPDWFSPTYRHLVGLVPTDAWPWSR